MGRLEGKIAFVTGAGGGIARSICGRFMEEGARIAATDIDLQAAEVSIASASARQAIAFECDAGDSSSVQGAIARAVDTFGGLNVLCNIAGGSTLRDGKVTDAPEDEFWRAIRLDLFGPWLSCRFGIPELIKAGGGSIINMSSMVAFIGSSAVCYTAAKGGVAAMTRSMAASHAADGIRVNAIAPGVTLSPRVQERMRANPDNPRHDRHLLGLVDPIDIAELAVYLASDESRRVTGQVMRVDSGVTIN
jgi:NAD(P)-dependent dehydrogenase (short-subunit alcohol dehydrogenase family)